MPNIRICIDSSVLIPALQDSDPDSVWLLGAIGPNFPVIIPRLIAQEVNRNLTTPKQVQRFYRLFTAFDSAFIVDDPIPRRLVEKYVSLGLPEKGDAFIGAFVEWLPIPFLISANRHFLRDLRTEAFRVFEPTEFRAKLRTGTL